jgi:uncharacterized membrane-anchored protein
MFSRSYVNMNRLTKVSVLIPAIFMIMTAYAFAAFIGYHIKPMAAPVKLLLTGVTMVAVGHFIKHFFQK